MAETQELTQKQILEQAINNGGTVFFKGRHIKRLADLPSDAELAQGDPKKAEQAKAQIRAQMLALQAQAEMLGGLDPVEQKTDIQQVADQNQPVSATSNKKKIEESK